MPVGAPPGTHFAHVVKIKIRVEPARTFRAGPPPKSPPLLSKLDAGWRRSRCVLPGRRQHAGCLIHLKYHDIRRILVSNVDKVTRWIEIEMPRRTALRVSPAEHGQLESQGIDRADHDVIV